MAKHSALTMLVLEGLKRGPKHDDGEDDGSEGAHDDSVTLEDLMKEFCEAEKAEDYAGMADALRAAFHHLEDEPHGEADSGAGEEEGEGY